jgi:aldose 1-epimerase
VNLTQHSYFNLAGGGRGDVLGHVLTIDADHYLPIDATSIPTGPWCPWRDAVRFPRARRHRPAHRRGGRAARARRGLRPLLRRAARGPGLVTAARLDEPVSGRRIEVRTTEPGVQFYSGNRLDGRVRGKSGRAYPPRAGLSLETQHYPDSPNHPEFPSTVLQPGQEYRSTTVFTFGVC